MRRLLPAALAASFLLAPAACQRTVRVKVDPPAPAPARDSARLTRLGVELWEETMRSSPVWATFLGDRRHDESLGDAGPAERERHRAVVTRILAETRTLDRASLTPGERTTADVIEHVIGTSLESDARCESWSWSIDQMYGPQVWLAELPQMHPIRTWEHALSLAARYGNIPEYYEQHRKNLLAGSARGRVAAKVNIERVIQQLDDQLAVPVEKSPYLDAMKALPGHFTEAQVAELRALLETRTREDVYPAMKAYRGFLDGVLRPVARKQAGIGSFPDAAACYAARIREETGSDKTAEQIHALGLAEVARIQGEIRALAKLPAGAPIRPVFDALGTRKDMFLSSREAVLEHNRKLVARAQAALPRAFNTLPRTPIEVKALEPFREKDAPAGYYQSAPKDRSRSAYYYSNTYQPETRPLWNMAALAFHEGVPGHHVQIALAEENTSIPEFQRRLGMTAFVEGWALYSERLAGELGLYETTEEKLGALNYEAWRAVRLVVDTGIHSKGWSREEALAYFLANTGHTKIEAENEIDRYIMWPGQALAYKMGQLEILEMREEAKRTLGAAFDDRAFHDRLLSNGAVPMPAARRDLREWAAAQRPR